MRKILLFIMPFLLILLSCDMSMPGTGGNPDEGRTCNQNILKVHANSLRLEMSIKCLYEKECDVDLDFGIIEFGDSLSGFCLGGGEWQFESIDTLMTVATKNGKKYPVKLSQDDHLLFSLIDINNVEKKYDIDLSGITRSYTVRGNSVDVNVMRDCSFKLYYCNKETVYGNQLPNGQYTFLTTEGCDKESSYRCLWHNQGPSQKDDLNISATIYWKK